MQLRKNMYALRESTLFGLENYAPTPFHEQIVHNGGWYNSLGQKMGFGSITKTHLKRIHAEIDPNETFYILPERDSSPHLVEGDIDVEEPGIDYVRDHARFVITRCRIMENIHRVSGRDGDWFRVNYDVSNLVVNFHEGTQYNGVPHISYPRQVV